MSIKHRLPLVLLWIVALLLIIGFIAINLVVPLPSFLVAENLLVAFVIAAGLLSMRIRPVIGISILIFVSLFYAGRISRSVINTSGSLAPMWDAHAPVAVLLAVLGILSLIVLVTRRGLDSLR